MPVSTDSAHGQARLPPMPSDPLWARRWKGDRHNQEGTSIVCLQLAYLLQVQQCPEREGQTDRRICASQCRGSVGMWWYHRGDKGWFSRKLKIRSRGGELQLNLEGWGSLLIRSLKRKVFWAEGTAGVKTGGGKA